MSNPEENVLAEWFVDNRYTEVDSRSFYREIFPDGLFDVRDAKTPDVGRGLVQTIQKTTKKDDNQFQAVGKTITIYDDLTELYQTIDDSVKLYEQYQRKGVADRVQILTCTNGCSYMGHECLAENVYMMSAMIIEIDDIIYDENGMSGAYCYNPIGLKNMLNQMRPVEMPRSGKIRPAVYPTPTYIVCSGSGMHLYYVFQEPLRINKKYFPKHYEAVDLYKKCFMGALWRSKTITEKPVEIQGIAQRYRCVGSPTKTGSVVRAFQIGDKVSLKYMNSFRDNLRMKVTVFRNVLSYQELSTRHHGLPDHIKRKLTLQLVILARVLTLRHWKELKHQLCFFQILSLYNDFCNLISSIILSSSKTGLNSCASKHAQYIYGCPS